MSMDSDIPLLLSLLFIVGGLALLAYSADMFVDASGRLARRYRLPPFIIGMVVIGFGTSAPELAVSAISGVAGHSNLSLGNAYGSCVFNIAMILGAAALIRPLRVAVSVCRFAVPVLLAITVYSFFIVRDGTFTRFDGAALLALFAVILPLYCRYERKTGAAGADPAENGGARGSAAGMWFGLVAGLVLLVASSHVLVWGCVDFARDVIHASDLLIGLTVVAAGTSLPELASAVAAARRGESEFVVGNIVGSNLFNMLAVVGIAGVISPFDGFSGYVVSRDLPAVLAVTILLWVFGFNRRNRREPGCISRIEGAALIAVFLAYLATMILQETARA